MIGKVERQPATEYVQIERTPKEPEPQAKESVVAEHPSREAAEQTANSRKNEMAITSSTQKALLDSQIQTANPTKQSAVAAKQPEPIADSSSTQTLKPGDKGPEVTRLIYDLQIWQKQNGLEITPWPKDAVYTEEVERAVRQFQIANNMYATGKVDSNVRNRLTLESDPNFRILDNEVKQSIRSTMDIHADQPAAQKNIMDLATDRQFAHLISKDSQKAALNGLIMHPEDKNHLKNVQDAVLDVAILEKEKTLDHLPENTKRQVINTIFKKTEDSPVHIYLKSREARTTVIELAKHPQFGSLTESQQQKLLDAAAANPGQAAGHMVNIIDSPAFKNMDKKMKAHVIDLAAENAMYPVLTGKNMNDSYNQRIDSLELLITSQRFLEASEEDKWSQLKPYKTGLPNSKPEIDIL